MMPVLNSFGCLFKVPEAKATCKVGLDVDRFGLENQWRNSHVLFLYCFMMALYRTWPNENTPNILRSLQVAGFEVGKIWSPNQGLDGWVFQQGSSFEHRDDLRYVYNIWFYLQVGNQWIVRNFQVWRRSNWYKPSKRAKEYCFGGTFEWNKNWLAVDTSSRFARSIHWLRFEIKVR